MSAFETPADLAAALYCRGERPINAERVAKFMRHVDSREDFEAAVTALPADVQADVRTWADPWLRKKGL